MDALMLKLIDNPKINIYEIFIPMDDSEVNLEELSKIKKPQADDLLFAKSKATAFFVLKHADMNKLTKKIHPPLADYVREYLSTPLLSSDTTKGSVASNERSINPNILVGGTQFWRMIELFDSPCYSEPIDPDAIDNHGRTHLHDICSDSRGMSGAREHFFEFLKHMPNPFIRDKNDTLPNTSSQLRAYEKIYLRKLLAQADILDKVRDIFTSNTRKGRALEEEDVIDIKIACVYGYVSLSSRADYLLKLLEDTENISHQKKIVEVCYQYLTDTTLKGDNYKYLDVLVKKLNDIKIAYAEDEVFMNKVPIIDAVIKKACILVPGRSVSIMNVNTNTCVSSYVVPICINTNTYGNTITSCTVGTYC